jgi:L-ascorbate metabolism protein UlaG (beta-lactamase superfamily)
MQRKKKWIPVYKNNSFEETVGALNFNVYFHILSEYFSSIKNIKEWKKYSKEQQRDKFDFSVFDNDEHPLIIYLGHGTVFVKYKGVSFIFDPIFTSPSFFIKRYVDFIEKELIPRVDHIIISHDHPDHFDLQSIEFFLKKNKDLKIHVPLGIKDLFKINIKESVNEYTWWQNEKFNLFNFNLEISCLPAKHWSQAGLFDKNKTLWCSWSLKLDNYIIYFGGDTSYGEHFLDIQAEIGDIDVACLPIAPCLPRRLQKNIHIDYFEAIKAFFDLNAKYLVPIHWGVFNYGEETPEFSINKLKEELRKLDMQEILALSKVNDSFYLKNEIENKEYINLGSKNRNIYA